MFHKEYLIFKVCLYELILNLSRELSYYLRVEVATTAAVWREEGKDITPKDCCHWQSSSVPPQLLMATTSATLGSLDQLLLIIFRGSKGLCSMKLTFENNVQL